MQAASAAARWRDELKAPRKGKRQISNRQKRAREYSSRLSIGARKAIRISVIATIPWLPAFLFQWATFHFHVTQSALYGWFTGTRLAVDSASFALGGIVIAFLLRPKWALTQILASTVIIWTLFYQLCETFRTPIGLFSSCYHTGPDGLAGYRLAMMMFSFGALPILVRTASLSTFHSKLLRAITAITAGTIVTVVMTWFPMTAWFSGASYQPIFLPIHAAVLFGLPQIASGIIAARIGRSVRPAAVSGPAAAFFTTASLWTLSCPSCDRGLLYWAIPLWGVFAGLGGILELGTARFGSRIISLKRLLPGMRQIALAAAITVSLWTIVAYPFWAPSVLYSETISTGPGPLHLGLPIYRPYVAGYYNSTQYRICCLEIGVSFIQADPQQFGPGNFLMAGMGVQSPNCCVDGWDFGWRADVFLLSNGTMLVSGSSWQTCDANANCGGHFWQDLRYHVHQTISPPEQSSTIYLRMMWESGQLRWYYNYTGVLWQNFGAFTPDFRDNPYFDIGVIGPGHGRDPLRDTYFFQFGVGSKFPTSGWTVRLLYPSFQFEGSWGLMEKAAIIQGDWSVWKVAYRWGGAPYDGVTVKAKALDPSFPPNVAEFAYTGGELPTNTPLW